jgi:hypothetical protein
MGKKKTVSAHPTSWIVSNEIQVNGRIVSVGTEISIIGESGRFRFMKHVKTETSEWIDVIGGKKGYSTCRSFRVSQVKTVHWKNRTDKNIVKELKERKERLKSEAELGTESE